VWTLAATTLALLLPTAGVAQERQPLTDAVRPFVAVDAPVVALTGVRLADGTGSPAREEQVVIVRGARIEAVGAAGDVAVPADARVIDLAGHTLIPGLVSLHEHTWFGGLQRSAPLSVGAYLYLAFGVTTGMTAGSQMPYQELNLKRSIDGGVIPGPRLHIAGPYITGGEPRPAANRIISNAEEAERVVAYWAAEGATWFKVLNGPTDVLRAVIDAAHARGLRVTGHLCSVTFSDAAAMGIDALQHGFITNSEYVPGKQPDVCPPENMRIQADVDVESDAVRESIRRIVEHGAAVVSTLGVYETFSPARARLDPRAMAMLEPGTHREVEHNHASLRETPFVVPERLLSRMMRWERMFVDAGGLLGAGSDPWGTGFLPGFGNLRNYELLIEAGFPAEEAVRILTLNGARILGEADRFGSIEPGKIADLVVIRGDPLAEPSKIYDVTLVFKHGVGYDSQKLQEFARGRVGAF
jgi:hypothetical protein